METYYISCEKYIAKKNWINRKAKQNSLMLLSSCVVCGKNKLTFIKN